jgi:AraC-like DNA-binding protein
LTGDSKVKNWVERLKSLAQIAYYMATDPDVITPYTIPDNLELVELITGGEVFFDLDGVQKTFGKGTIFWHQSGEQTVWRTTRQALYRAIVFQFHVSDRNRPVNRVSFWNPQSDLDRFVAECLSLYHAQKLDENVLMFYTYSTLLRHAMTTDDSSNRSNYPKSLDLSLDYIHHHLTEKLSIAALARHSRISPSQCFRLFQTHLRTTPHQYILSLQLSKARILLAGSQLTIKEIASECGFESLEVFYRRFHRENKIPPGEYRRKYLPYQFSKKMDR